MTWQIQLRSASLRAPTPRCSASCPPPGHAPPEPPATQSPRRPPEPSQSRLRRMGALGPKPPPPLLLLILGKPGPRLRLPVPPDRCPPPGDQPRPPPQHFGAPRTPFSVRGSPSLPGPGAQLLSVAALRASLGAGGGWGSGEGSPVLGRGLGHSEDPPRCRPQEPPGPTSQPAHSGPEVAAPKCCDSSLPHSASGPALGARPAWAVSVHLYNCPSWLEAQGPVLPTIFEARLP